MAIDRALIRSAVLVAVGALVAAPIPAAHAQPPSALQCLGTESDAYSPGVIFQPREFTVTTDGQLTACLDSAGHMTSGAYGPEQFSLDVGCNDLLDAFQSTRILTWSTGDTSVMQGTGQSTEVAGTVVTTITGTITRGRFQGSSAVQTITLPQPGVLQCLTTGYTGATGLTTLTLV